MRVTTAVIVIIALAASQGLAASKVNLEASGTPIKDVAKSLSDQSGVVVVVDPSIDIKISINLSDSELPKAVEVIAKLNNLQWKKLKFARPADGSVSLEQIKSAILAIAAIQVTAISIEDPVAKTCSMIATNLPEPPDTANVKLPEGYSWVEAYVILPRITAESSAATSGDKLKSISDTSRKNMLDLTQLTPEERRQVYMDEWMSTLNLTPEARRSLISDRIAAMHDLPEQYRDQIRDDMRNVFRGLRDQGIDMGPRHGGGDREPGDGDNRQ